MSFKMPSFSGDEDIDGCKGGINTICLILKSTANITIDTTATLNLKGNDISIQATRNMNLSGRKINMGATESITIGSPDTRIS
jgi:hypothetical protein